MKLTERSNGLYLEDIQQVDIRFSNLAGRLTGSIYENPDRPAHVYVLWITDPDIVTALQDYGIRVRERVDEETGDVRYSVQFKAYPKMRMNKRSGKEEPNPKIMLKTTGSTIRLDTDSFGLADSAHIETADLRFHPWQYDDKKPDCVAVIDELWVTVDESAGESDYTYLSEKHGYEESEADEIAFWQLLISKAKEKGMSEDEIARRIQMVAERGTDE